MRITYVNNRVEKLFTDFVKMQKTIPYEWVRTIKKHLNHIEAADSFGVLMSLGLSNLEQLKGYSKPTYSLKITGNVRLIFEVKSEQDNVKECKDIEVKGVCDYHGDKDNWYIP